MRLAYIIICSALLASCQAQKKEPQTRAEILAEMFANPITRPLAEDIIRADMGLPPRYPGNCPTGYDYDAIGNRCGLRSAADRPGGY